MFRASAVSGSLTVACQMIKNSCSAFVLCKVWKIDHSKNLRSAALSDEQIFIIQELLP